MAEIVEYRVERTVDDLNLLVEFGLFTEQHARAILAKRQNFEYILRRRTRTKLDFLKYIRFEVNLLESIDNYRKKVIKNFYKPEKTEDDDILGHKILLLQAKKLADVIRNRSAHVTSLFRQLTECYKFDSKLWLAYIDFAKSRKWNTRVSTLYWKLLRLNGNDQNIWLAAAAHELDVGRAYDTARGLYLRALRHFPDSPKVWAEYFKMEVKFMNVVEQRSRIVFKCTQKDDKKDTEEDIWAEKDIDVIENGDHDDATKEEIEKTEETNTEESLQAIPIEDDDSIISGQLPKAVYKNAAQSLKQLEKFNDFLITILDYILNTDEEFKGIDSLRDYICQDIRDKSEANDLRIPKELASLCANLDSLKKYVSECIKRNEESISVKRQKKVGRTKMDQLYEIYESKGIEDTRCLFNELEKSVINQTLSLYVGMIQVEMWQLAKDKNDTQLDRIRLIYDKALVKFGKTKPKLWYEYLQFEHDNSKNLDDFDRINRLYLRAQSTLHPSKVDRVIEKYTLLQVNSSSADIEYSDYSDLDD